jgi:predicted kinase
VELVILVGLQASGKSTFARQRFAATHVYVSKDALRSARDKELRQRSLVEAALQEGRSVVIDNTNPGPDDRSALIALGRQYGAEVVGYYFEPDLAASRERNRQREGRARVPDVALYVTRKKLRPPEPAEGFDRLYRVRLVGEEFAVETGV